MDIRLMTHKDNWTTSQGNMVDGTNYYNPANAVDVQYGFLKPKAKSSQKVVTRSKMFGTESQYFNPMKTQMENVRGTMMPPVQHNGHGFYPAPPLVRAYGSGVEGVIRKVQAIFQKIVDVIVLALTGKRRDMAVAQNYTNYTLKGHMGKFYDEQTNRRVQEARNPTNYMHPAISMSYSSGVNNVKPTGHTTIFSRTVN